MTADVAFRQPSLRVALYSHDTMGIGHMRRNMLIAQTFAAPPTSATVLLIAGARTAAGFALPHGVDCLTLPSLHKTTEGQYRSRALNVRLGDLIELRSHIVAAALAEFDPDVLVVDKEPRGALGELNRALTLLHGRGKTRCILGLRDVLDDPSEVRREWETAGSAEAIREFYHAIWIYGDRAVYDPSREYGMPPEICTKVAFTGYLNPCRRLQVAGRQRDGDDHWVCGSRPYALCLVGGGQDGAALAETFADATLPRNLDGVIIAGPDMPPAPRHRLHCRAAGNPRLRVKDFDAEPCRFIQGADCVVAMGGYNTVSEILAFEKRALVVPRVKPRTEQLIRAQRMSALGLLEYLRPEHLSPGALSQWVAHGPSPAVKSRRAIDLNGTGRLPHLLHSVLAGSRSTLTPPPPPEAEPYHAVR